MAGVECGCRTQVIESLMHCVGVLSRVHRVGRQYYLEPQGMYHSVAHRGTGMAHPKAIVASGGTPPHHHLGRDALRLGKTEAKTHHT